MTWKCWVGVFSLWWAGSMYKDSPPSWCLVPIKILLYHMRVLELPQPLNHLLWSSWNQMLHHLKWLSWPAQYAFEIPNIILISVDLLSWEHFYNHDCFMYRMWWKRSVVQQPSVSLLSCPTFWTPRQKEGTSTLSSCYLLLRSLKGALTGKLLTNQFIFLCVCLCVCCDFKLFLNMWRSVHLRNHDVYGTQTCWNFLLTSISCLQLCLGSCW